MLPVDTSSVGRLLKTADRYYMFQMVPGSWSKFGGLLTILTPVACAAFAAVLIFLFVVRPIVVTTSSESALFTAPVRAQSTRIRTE